ncbi:MAG: N-acetyltransferase [Dehalobacterium sp.]
MIAGTRIQFAEAKDEERLREILLDCGMDISGRIEDHLIIKEGDEIFAGGKVIEYQSNHFYLEILVVKGEKNGRGFGGYFLKTLVKDPGQFCKKLLSQSNDDGSYLITTISRGNASGFYQKYGFTECDFSQMPSQYQEQCIDCPDKENCNPVPMIFSSASGDKNRSY